MKLETKLAIILVVNVLFFSFFAGPTIIDQFSKLCINAIDHELDKNDAAGVRHNRR